IYEATGTGGSAATTDLIVESPSSVEISTNNMSVETIQVPGAGEAIYTVYSEEGNVYVNSIKVDASAGYQIKVNPSSGQTISYRIITQNDLESPYITLLNFTRP
ncbi:MAG: hypothetical protein LBE16_02920, partial [Clostridiales Family XIII bacterium]|nr:hypothetical protein [Clostridiales Family XIII bacterium]